jgi:hypothetical protein
LIRANIKDTISLLILLDELREHFMMYKSESKKGNLKNKCVLTNAFLNQNAPAQYRGNNFTKKKKN